MLIQVVECACIVELKALGGYQKLQAKHPEVKVRSSVQASSFLHSFLMFHQRNFLQVWGLISEDVLNLEGTLSA